MSGLTNSGRPGSGKNRFRLGARITLPVVDGYCYVFQNWVFIGVELIHLALPEDSFVMMLCLNTQASPKLPSHTAGGHSVESAEKRKKIFSLLLSKSCLDQHPSVAETAIAYRRWPFG